MKQQILTSCGFDGQHYVSWWTIGVRSLAWERLRITVAHNSGGLGRWALGLDSRWGTPLRCVSTPNLRSDRPWNGLKFHPFLYPYGSTIKWHDSTTCHDEPMEVHSLGRATFRITRVCNWHDWAHIKKTLRSMNRLKFRPSVYPYGSTIKWHDSTTCHDEPIGVHSLGRERFRITLVCN